MTTRSYRIQLLEVRLATDGTDDVAFFEVTRGEGGETWIVPVLLSPLFRLTNMRTTVSMDSRRDMVAGLGARSIIERLEQGTEPLNEPLLFSLDYPGAPGDPEPLASYEHAIVEVEEPVST